jgi:hypothetical protein
MLNGKEKKESHFNSILFYFSAGHNAPGKLNLAFSFDIREISEINDRGQDLSIPMYFSVAWLENRLWINESSPAWDENVTGPQNVSFLMDQTYKVAVVFRMRFVLITSKCSSYRPGHRAAACLACLGCTLTT